MQKQSDLHTLAQATHGLAGAIDNTAWFIGIAANHVRGVDVPGDFTPDVIRRTVFEILKQLEFVWPAVDIQKQLGLVEPGESLLSAAAAVKGAQFLTDAAAVIEQFTEMLTAACSIQPQLQQWRDFVLAGGALDDVDSIIRSTFAKKKVAGIKLAMQVKHLNLKAAKIYCETLSAPTSRAVA